MTLHVELAKAEKTSIIDTTLKNSENFLDDSQSSGSAKFLMQRRFRISHGKDLTELLEEVRRFTSWIYLNNYNKLTFSLIPDDVLECLHPVILSGLLRVFAKRKRQRIQPEPWIMVRDKWIKVDWESNCICISQIYRRRDWDLVLPLPDFGDVEIAAILWIKVDAETVEYVCGVDIPEPTILIQGDDVS